MRNFTFPGLSGAAILGAAGFLIATPSSLNAQQPASVKIKASDIGGVVSSARGPEAGVWVIAETADLPTGYIKEVVTEKK